MVAGFGLFAIGFVGDDGVFVVEDGGNVGEGHGAAFDGVGVVGEIESGESEEVFIVEESSKAEVGGEGFGFESIKAFRVYGGFADEVGI